VLRNEPPHVAMEVLHAKLLPDYGKGRAWRQCEEPWMALAGDRIIVIDERGTRAGVGDFDLGAMLGRADAAHRAIGQLGNELARRLRKDLVDVHRRAGAAGRANRDGSVG